ncbi:hypothetical protein D1P53_005609 [Cryptococcus gattii VGV]|nr:hypothetical protein D1P53_005609 [Cryptococcus gattii VGV]
MDPLIIQNHLDKLAIQFKGLVNGHKYDSVLLERHKIHLAAQTLSAPEHITYAKTARNQLTFQEWATQFKKQSSHMNLATLPCFIDNVQGYVTLLEDADSALPDAFVTTFV